MPVAYVFPGQGSQYVGMGAGLDPATFAEADDALGFSLSDIIRLGPEEKLAETAYTQPAILTVSIAMLRRLEREVGWQPMAAAGHSLGEYSALVASGALAFADAVRLVRLRGQAMQDAVPLGTGGMAAVMGLDAAVVEAICAEQAQGEVVEIAGYNAPGQLVVAGHLSALQRVIDAVDAARGMGKRLAVSAPFHCRLLGPAAERLRAALTTVPLQAGRFPVVHNVDATVAPDAEGVRARLVAQVMGAVRWEDCVTQLKRLGATRSVEVGPGKTLAGLIKRIERSLTPVVLDSADGYEKARGLE